MKRRVNQPTAQTASTALSTSRLLVVVPFCVLVLWRVTLLLNALEATSPLTAFASALVITLVIGFSMTLSRSAFFLLGLLLSGYLLTNVQGQPLGIVGAFLWLFGGLTAFLLTLSVASRVITPPFYNLTSAPGLRLLLRQALPWRGKTGPPHAVGSIPKSFETLRAGEVPAHEVYAIFQGIKYFGAVGPGYIAMERSSIVRAVYDLRTQSRSMPLRVTTADGIELDTTINVRFAVRKRPNADEDIPYPYDPKAVEQLVLNEIATGTPGGESLTPVFKQVAPRAALYAAERIAHYRLDALLQVNNANAAQILQAINEDIEDKTKRYFNDKGLAVESAGIGALILPEQINEARLDHWRKRWRGQIDNRPNKAISQISKEEAEARLSVIHDLLENVKTLREAGASMPLPAELIDRIGAIITDAATDGLLSSLIPTPRPAEDKAKAKEGDKDKKENKP